MKNLKLWITVMATMLITLTSASAQQPDALSKLLKQEIQKQQTATVELYKQHDLNPAMAATDWRIADNAQTRAENSALVKKQFTNDKVAIKEQIAEENKDKLSLDAQIKTLVKEEQQNIQRMYLNDRFIENLTNGTCYEAAKLIANPNAPCAAETSNSLEESKGTL